MKLKPNIHENGIDYTLSGDCYLPELKLPEETRPIGRLGGLHREYLKNYRPLLYQALCLSGKLYTILADLYEQAAERCRLIVQQMAQAEGMTEEMKARETARWGEARKDYRRREEESS